MAIFTEREQVVEIINRLFYYTDFPHSKKLIIFDLLKEIKDHFIARYGIIVLQHSLPIGNISNCSLTFDTKD